MPKSETAGFFRTAKEAGKLYRKTGISVILFLLVFELARDYIFIPLISRLWSLGLSTTPEGYLDLSNLLNTLKESPWILLFGLAAAILYAVLTVWQTSTILISAGCARKGLKLRFRDLVRYSLVPLKNSFRIKNWMILVFCLVIVPAANIYQTNDMVTGISFPEYIQDFIDTKLLIWVIYAALFLFLAFLALKWMLLLPSFVLKQNDFKAAREESRALTEKGLLGNGIKISIYSIFEALRLSVIPMLLVLLPSFFCYRLSSSMDYASGLYRYIGVTMGTDAVKSLIGTFAQISAVCFLTELYFEKLEAQGLDTEIRIPVPEKTDGCRLGIRTMQALFSTLFSVILVLLYLCTVVIAQTDSDIIYELIGRTEIIAHKGYSSLAPENTMPAFDLADKCEDVSYIELDVWSSKDGIPVVVHNESIEAATGVDRYVYDCTCEELQQLPAPYAMSEEDFPDARIPTLEEVMEKYAASTPLLIEIKGAGQDPELPAKIAALMKKYQCEYSSRIQSSDYDALKKIKQIDPGICCGYIMALAAGNYYDLPYADFFTIEHTFVTLNTVENIHKRGKEVYAWTVNYDSSAEKLLFTGVDGMITDYPERIGDYVGNGNALITDVIFHDLKNQIETGTQEMERAASGQKDDSY